ncbi:DNA topoisomerase IV, alpha subunit [Lentithecium fluviatile CBS 122367]|uniref:DNA topoisomerase (ATP-hydrolyzing) n=1 Tax=Lentithecium fluviatile CBS 122367 TaxID=1168545 RepID=A0A6G1J3Q1_9PLEO|nr:DNA topoisomerase IV, alpha subunit [Lentithecium fluviatile CBS 122367]
MMDPGFEFEESLFDFSLQDQRDADWDDGSDDDMLETLYGDNDAMLPFTLSQGFPDGLSTVPSDNVDLGGERIELGSAVLNRDGVIARIENILTKIVGALLDDSDEAQLSVALRTRSHLSRRQYDQPRDISATPPPKVQEISYPGNSVQEAWRFTVVVRILELIHSCLIEHVVMTKRDMYYRHPGLFGKQSVVDQYVDDIACTFGVPRSLLNVTAAAKGLIAGNFIIRRQDGSLVHGLSEQEGILVPKIHEGDALDLSSIHWILVIEKEASFRSLLSSKRWRDLGAHGLVLTAKGYPDLASRKFLRHLSDTIPKIPMFALVDHDPDGIAIMSTYKYGSYRLAHEDIAHKDTPGLKLPELQWLGVQSHHISRTPVNEGVTETAVVTDLQGLMRLSGRDRRKAQQMLEWDICAEDGPEAAWRTELQRMLMLNTKAEMQILDELPGGLVSWLSNELEAKQGLSSAVGADEEILF